jgi:3-keto-disaccharide hydrolase
MPIAARLLCAVLLSSFPWMITAVAQNAAPSLPESKSAPEWRPLFSGRDLEGWKQVGSARWKVEDGVIIGGQEGDPKRSGLLTTVEQFQDFELELDFMIDEHGKYNSGVYLRNDLNERGRTGYQVNIGRGAAEEYCAGLFTNRWLAKGDEHDTIRRKLDWNKLRILARGAHIEVTLNDVKVVDYTDPEPPERFLKPGVLALQTYGAEAHSGWVKFRNIRIRPLR